MDFGPQYSTWIQIRLMASSPLCLIFQFSHARLSRYHAFQDLLGYRKESLFGHWLCYQRSNPFGTQLWQFYDAWSTESTLFPKQWNYDYSVFLRQQFATKWIKNGVWQGYFYLWILVGLGQPSSLCIRIKSFLCCMWKCRKAKFSLQQ